MKIKLFTSTNCRHCKRIKEELDKIDVEVEYININDDEGLQQALSYGIGVVPTIIYNDTETITGFKTSEELKIILKV